MNTTRSALYARFVITVAIAIIVASACTFVFVRHIAAQQLTGFKIAEIRFDESMGEKKPTPTLPSAWRFIGVSNGEKRNSNNLWFQDKDGSIYLVQGFTTEHEFIVQENVQKLNASH
jgi:hypothetical protein